MALLELHNLSVRYGRIEAVTDLSLDLEEGKISALIGANGAGKTSILHAISGLLRPASGTIIFDGKDITNGAPDAIVKAGIAQVAEGRAMLSPLTVEENLEMGAFIRKDQKNIRAEIKEVYELFPRLGERRKQLSGSLSGGEQQMLAIGRALMCKPRVLLLDEPSMGLAPLLINAVFDFINIINKKGMTILLVEQNAVKALKTAAIGHVLEHGILVKTAPANTLLEDPALMEAFLGK